MVKIADHLVNATLLKRENRFVGIININGSIERCHIMNPGRMVCFLQPGASLLVEKRDRPGRKLSYSLIYVILQDTNKTMILIDSQAPNQIVKEALIQRTIPEFAKVTKIESEIRYGKNQKSRIDLLLDYKIYIEVKATNYAERTIGYFPDAPSIRAQKHITELIHTIENHPNTQAWIFFIAQRNDIQEIHPFDIIDPVFGNLLREGAKKGIKLKAFQIVIENEGKKVKLGKEIPVILGN